MLQVSPTLFSSLLAQAQSLYERLASLPPAATPAERPVVDKKMDPLRLTAGFDDPRLVRRVAEVTANEAELARNDAPGLQRRRSVLNHLHRVAVAGRSFDPCLLANLLLLMDTPDTRAFLGRWGRGEFIVYIANDHQIDERLRGSGYTPAGQIAFYAPPNAGEKTPWIFLRELPPMTNGKQMDWVKGALERLLGAFHEEDHVLQFSGHFDAVAPGVKPFLPGNKNRRQFLITETMSLLREYQIRLSLGDASIGEDAARRGQTVAEYLAWCASHDVPGAWLSRLMNRLRTYLGVPPA